MINNHAIAVIGFKRPKHIQETLYALSQNYSIDKAPLYIFIDGARDDPKEKQLVQQTQETSKAFPWKGKKIIHASPHNKGLQNAVRHAIDITLTDYKSIIVVEDDIVTSPYFYNFISAGLTQYENNQSIGAICGHVYSISRKIFNPHSPFFLKHFCCWGWATWRDRWNSLCWDAQKLNQSLNRNKKKELDYGHSRWVSGILKAQMNGYINTWDVQTGVSLFLQNRFCLYPPETLTNNIGWRNDGLSTHALSEYNPNAPMAYINITIPPSLQIRELHHARKAIQIMTKSPHSIVVRIIMRVYRKIQSLFQK